MQILTSRCDVQVVEAKPGVIVYDPVDDMTQHQLPGARSGCGLVGIHALLEPMSCATSRANHCDKVLKLRGTCVARRFTVTAKDGRWRPAGQPLHRGSRSTVRAPVGPCHKPIEWPSGRAGDVFRFLNGVLGLRLALA